MDSESSTAAPPVLPAPTGLEPLREHERIAVLDLLRGIALLGIFVVNMQLFAMTFAEWTAPAALDERPRSDIACWALVKVLFEYKFISLFSLLFGAGLVVQMTRAAARGRPFAWLYLRRLGVLALLGLAHGLLLWYGDILFVYACIGVWLLVFRRVPPRAMLVIAGAIVSVGVLLYTAAGTAGIVFSDFFQQWQAEMEQEADAAESESADPPADAVNADDASTDSRTPETAQDASTRSWWQSIESTSWCRAMSEAEWDPYSQRWKEAETHAFKHGPFTDALAFRAILYGMGVLSAPFGYGWHVFAMFLIGAAFMKLGFFTATDMRWSRRLLLVGLAIGLPLELVAALVHYRGLVGENWVEMTFATGLHEVGSVLLCLGLVGGVCLAARSRRVMQITRPIQAVGRMALTVYLFQTIISTALMYWWGLGWFGEVSRPQQLAVVIVIYGGLVIFATAWLGIFRMGPFEWLWRTATYLRPQPLRRGNHLPPSPPRFA